MKRITFARLAVLMLAVACLALLAGCGGDDNGGLSAADMARIDAAEMAAADAAADAAAADAEVHALEDEIADLQAQIDATDDDDTSDLDEQIAALMMAIEALQEKTADPMTPMEILDGTAIAKSANDVAAMSAKIRGQLRATYDHDDDESMVNLPDIDGADATTNAATRNVSHASQLASGGFLKDATIGVDLTSWGDLGTLSLSKLLKVDGVELYSFTARETDKVTVDASIVGDLIEAGTTAGSLPGVAAGGTRTIVLGADGSESITDVNALGQTTFGETTTYVGGTKVLEWNPLIAEIGATPLDPVDPPAVTATDADAAQVTMANGNTVTYSTDGTTATEYADPVVAAGTGSPAADRANAIRDYNESTVTPAQHAAKGYGAWLEDSFFAAYTLMAEDDAIIQDPDKMARKIVWGGREHDSAMAMNLSGRGQTAMWKGLMLGHDMDADAATFGSMLKGNASITARVGMATLADNSAADTPDIVDVSLTNIISAKGTAISRVADGIHWTNLDLEGGMFAKGSEIMGHFYDNGNEVVGQFDKEDIMGVFGAVEYEMMADDM